MTDFNPFDPLLATGTRAEAVRIVAGYDRFAPLHKEAFDDALRFFAASVLTQAARQLRNEDWHTPPERLESFAHQVAPELNPNYVEPYRPEDEGKENNS